MFKFARIASVLFTTLFLACAPTNQELVDEAQEALAGSFCASVPTSGGQTYCCREGNNLCCINPTSGVFCGFISD